jgi:predicted transcriptional regulator
MDPFENDDRPSPDMLEMYRLHRCMGLPQTKIAEQFGITQPTVSKYVARAEQWLRYQYRDQIALFRTRGTARLEHIYSESVQAWEASKAPEVVKTTRSEKGAEVTTIRESAQAGNPAFLRAAVEALQQIDDLWADEMIAADRKGSETRVAGMNQQQAIEAQIRRLQDQLGMLKTRA